MRQGVGGTKADAQISHAEATWGEAGFKCPGGTGGIATLCGCSASLSSRVEEPGNRSSATPSCSPWGPSPRWGGGGSRGPGRAGGARATLAQSPESPGGTCPAWGAQRHVSPRPGRSPQGLFPKQVSRAELGVQGSALETSSSGRLRVRFDYSEF